MGEAPELLRLMECFYREEHLVFQHERARRSVELLLGDESEGFVLLVREDGPSLGYAVTTFGFSLEFGGRFALLDELYLDPSIRKRGIGSLLIEGIVQECRTRGIETLRLEVEHENRGAHRLYTNLGFEQHNRHLMTLWLSSLPRPQPQ